MPETETPVLKAHQTWAFFWSAHFDSTALDLGNVPIGEAKQQIAHALEQSIKETLRKLGVQAKVSTIWR